MDSSSNNYWRLCTDSMDYNHIIILVVLALCFSGYMSSAWFLVIFIISLCLMFILLAIPWPYMTIVVTIIVIIICILAIIFRKYYWLATSLALVLLYLAILLISVGY